MDDNDFADWQVCWQVNLFYHKPIAKPQKCIVCEETHTYAEDVRRSAFWLDATRCSIGHRQALLSEMKTTGLGVCATCDQNYMFNLLKGEYVCRREGCRRIVRVHEAEVKDRLASDLSLFQSFQSIVQKRRVYDCLIHCDEVAYDTNLSKAFKGPTPACDHDRNVCDDCYKAGFESAIRGGRHDDLICLDPECKKPIPLDVIRSNVSPEIFKIHNKHLATKTISQAENFRWCDCGHGQIHEPRESNPEWFCILSACKKRNCYICKSSLTCAHLQAIDAKKAIHKLHQKKSAKRVLLDSAKKAEEAQKRALENEAGTMREMLRISKKCPKRGCPNKIERKAGCGHFTCPMCKTEFCWGCKVIWVKGSDGNLKPLHLNGCRIGTTNQVPKSRLELSNYAPGWDVDKGYDLSLDAGLWLLEGHR